MPVGQWRPPQGVGTVGEGGRRVVGAPRSCRAAETLLTEPQLSLCSSVTGTTTGRHLQAACRPHLEPVFRARTHPAPLSAAASGPWLERVFSWSPVPIALRGPLSRGSCMTFQTMSAFSASANPAVDLQVPCPPSRRPRRCCAACPSSGTAACSCLRSSVRSCPLGRALSPRSLWFGPLPHSALAHTPFLEVGFLNGSRFNHLPVSGVQDPAWTSSALSEVRAGF